MVPNRHTPERLNGEPRILEWLTLILQVVLLGAVIAYGQVMAERQAVLQTISASNQEILRAIQTSHNRMAGEPTDE